MAVWGAGLEPPGVAECQRQSARRTGAEPETGKPSWGAEPRSWGVGSSGSIRPTNGRQQLDAMHAAEVAEGTLVFGLAGQQGQQVGAVLG